MNLYLLRDLLMRPEFAQLSLIAAAETLNEKMLVRDRLVPIDDIEALLASTGELFAIRSSSMPELEPARWLFSNQHKLRNLDLQATTTKSLIAGVEQAGLVSAETVAVIAAMGVESISTAEQAGLGFVSPEDVRRARELP